MNPDEAKKFILSKKKNRRTQLKFECDPDESDTELPAMQRVVKPEISNKDYLKLYGQKNGTHDGDREKASSLVQNLSLPPPHMVRNNPIFDKRQKIERNLNLHAQDLFSISQIEESKLN